jgi:xylose isomerase
MLAGHSFEHDIHFASAYNMLGSIDMNTGEPSLGWDTDNFLFNGQQAVLIMLTVLKQNGLGKGGLNFDCKVRRESTDLEDLFISHIAAMDTMAYALKKSAKILEDGILDQLLNDRYISYTNTDLGKNVEKGTATLEECEEYIMKNGETKLQSANQEKFERILNNYLN